MATFVTKHLRIAVGVAEVEQGLRPTGWFSERTMWVGRLTPLRRFVRTETGGAAVLVAAVLAALVWANVGSSYQEVWETPVALTFGDGGIRLSPTTRTRSRGYLARCSHCTRATAWRRSE